MATASAISETNIQALPRQTLVEAATAGPATGGAMEQHRAWPMISRLPVILEVGIPLRGLRVCDLLNLNAGQTILSGWAVTADVPLKVGALKLCRGEFEVVERRMALRLTSLA